MSGFVYVWYDRKHKRYYVGSHWGTEDDGYICSSNNMKQNFRNRPQDFKRRIIARVITSHKDLLNEEQRWLNMIKPNEFGFRFYNINGKAGTYYWWMNEETKKLVGQKISDEHKQAKREAWNKGKKLSEEHKQKIANNHQSKKLGYLHPMLGQHHSKEVKAIIKEKRAKQIITDEHKQHIALGLQKYNKENKRPPVSAEGRKNMREARLKSKRQPTFNEKGQFSGFISVC